MTATRTEAALISCASCQACCCRLEVMLMGDDQPPEHLTGQDEWGGWVMRRLDDGWCAALDRDTLRCTIYSRRPTICRDYQLGDSDCLAERAKGLRLVSIR
jgi:Fe-S-cluster containining protein